MDQSVKITSFEAENIKRVKAVELKPSESGLTVIGGRNGQGKTSVLVKLCTQYGKDCVPYVEEYVRSMKEAVNQVR